MDTKAKRLADLPEDTLEEVRDVLRAMFPHKPFDSNELATEQGRLRIAADGGRLLVIDAFDDAIRVRRHEQKEEAKNGRRLT